jgi:UDP-N-acetylmuramate dehydrogenase
VIRGAGDATVVPRADVPLAPLSTLGVGGAARWYLPAASVAQVQAANRWAEQRGLLLMVLGGGSNVVISDAGFAGLVLHVVMAGVTIRGGDGGTVIDAGAGEPWDSLVARVVAAGYAGMECLSGIPGLTGGTPIQNVGAYGQEVADTIESVTVVDRRSGEEVVIPASACGFSYRQSRFKQADAGRFIVCRVAFHLRRGAPTLTYPDVVSWVERQRITRPRVGDIRDAVLDIRRRKGMVLDPEDGDTRSVGSFFMNPVVPAAVQNALGSPAFPMRDGRVKIPAAWLIERSGFAKGFAAGAVGLSSKHPLAIVNRGGARAADVVDLACRIKQAVLDRYGIALRPEPEFVGFERDDRVQFLQREHD